MAEANTLVVGGTAEIHVAVDKEYHLVKYIVSYKQLFIDFESISGIRHVLISDKSIDDPKEGCPAGSLYCSKVSSKRIIETVSVCVDEVLLYIFPSKDKDVFAKIKTDFVKDAPCNDIDRNPTNFCPLLTPVDCLAGCNTGCGLLTCQTMSKKKVFAVCLKDSINESNLKEMCDGHTEAKTHKWEVCGAKQNDSNWLVSIVVIILVTLLVFGGVVVYYQRMLQKNGRPPFKVPGFCPRKLFPREYDTEPVNLRVIQ